MKIVFLTAGAAGMYCGSCMHDNALAKALIGCGAECLLQPLYTPVRTDETSVAGNEVFFGGVNIYLAEKLPLYRRLPIAIRRLFDRPAFLKWATRRASATDASSLGDLTLTMLNGEHGKLRDEVERLVRWLRDEMRPDAIVLTNLLIAGSLPAIRRELPQTPVLAILQGDDAFLDYLPEPFRSESIAIMGRLGRLCDAVIVNSRFYAAKMGTLLDLPDELFRVMPLTIDTSPFENMIVRRAPEQPVTIGYLARIAPEKGLHHLVDAFISLASRPGCEATRLEIAGWLGIQNRRYLAEQMEKIAEAGLTSRVRHRGSPDLAGKLKLLGEIDILSVPTEHEEPKGLSVLEAMAAGVPAVLPARGAFPEIIENSGGGLLVAPQDPTALAEGLERLIVDTELRSQLGTAARQWVLEKRSVTIQARTLIELIETLKAVAK